MVGSRSRRRRGFAASACFLWLLGVEVLPNLHLAFHDDDDHTHASTGMIVKVSFNEPHDHGDGIHTHDEHDASAISASDSKRKASDQVAIGQFETNHAAAGLAHHALALHRPAPPLIAPLPVDRLILWVSDAPIERPVLASTTRPSARGPPAS